MEGTTKRVSFSFRHHPTYIENKKFFELEKTCLDVFKNNVLSATYEKSVDETIEVLKEQKLATQHTLGNGFYKIGYWIRSNNRFHARVQDFTQEYRVIQENYEQIDQHLTFEEVIYFILQAIVEEDYRNWIDLELKKLGVGSQSSTRPNALRDIFRDIYYPLCEEVLIACEIKDENGEVLLHQRNQTRLNGFLSALKKFDRRILKRVYSYPELLKHFNAYLGTTYKNFKDNSQSSEFNNSYTIASAVFSRSVNGY